MHGWNKALIIAAAMLAATATADAHMGGMGGRFSGGFHGFHGFHSRPSPFHFHRRDFRIAFPNAEFGSARSEGWGGGAYSGDVAGFDYGEDDDFAPEDLHFRVQDSFGPGDIGRPSPPPQPYDDGPWDATRMDPSHGYEPDN
jgi:opacity protein-like surface antigen